MSITKFVFASNSPLQLQGNSLQFHCDVCKSVVAVLQNQDSNFIQRTKNVTKHCWLNIKRKIPPKQVRGIHISIRAAIVFAIILTFLVLR